MEGLANGSGNEGSGTLGPYGRLPRPPVDLDLDPEAEAEPDTAVGDKNGLSLSSCTGVAAFPLALDPRLTTGVAVVVSKKGFD